MGASLYVHVLVAIVIKSLHSTGLLALTNLIRYEYVICLAHLLESSKPWLSHSFMPPPLLSQTMMRIYCRLTRPFLFFVGLGTAGVHSFSQFGSSVDFPRSAGLKTPRSTLAMSATASATTSSVPSWTDLADQAAATPVGRALNAEVALRKQGRGSAARENTLRKFDREGEPVVTLYRYVCPTLLFTKHRSPTSILNILTPFDTFIVQ